MDDDGPRPTTSRDDATDGRSDADKAPPTARQTIETQVRGHLQRADEAETRVRELEEELAYRTREMRQHRVAAERLSSVLDEEAMRKEKDARRGEVDPIPMDGDRYDDGPALDRIARQR